MTLSYYRDVLRNLIFTEYNLNPRFSLGRNYNVFTILNNNLGQNYNPVGILHAFALMLYLDQQNEIANILMTNLADLRNVNLENRNLADFVTKIAEIPKEITKSYHYQKKHLTERKNDKVGTEEEGIRKCPSCKDGNLLPKVGEYGAFKGCSNYPECNYTDYEDDKVKRELVGVDIFVSNNGQYELDDYVLILDKITRKTKLELKVIMCGKQEVFPTRSVIATDNRNFTFRFLAKKKTISSANINKLLSKFDKYKLEYYRIEQLYIYDDEYLGFFLPEKL